MIEPMDVAALQAQYRGGARPKYLFFWGHAPERPGAIDASCLSNWYPAPFELEGRAYPTAEHFMMAEKARLFGDAEVLARVLEAPHPGAAKKLGRQVRGFSEDEWLAHRYGIVARGVAAKFAQNRALGEYLLATGDRVLVEASPRDRIWGIGLGKRDPRAQDPLEWRGLNLLGFALMAARAQLEP